MSDLFILPIWSYISKGDSVLIHIGYKSYPQYIKKSGYCLTEDSIRFILNDLSYKSFLV